MIKLMFGLKFIFAKQGLYLVLCLAVIWICSAIISLPKDNNGNRSFISLLLTPDQQGHYLMKKQSYKMAATIFNNSALKGAAHYRDGQFKEAASLFGRSTSPVSFFNRGTAFIMAGLYDDAIESFEKALETEPEFEAAQINLEIAKIRKQKKLPPEDDHGGTGGMLEADEFVFSDRKPPSGNDQTEQVEADSDMSDTELRSLWLRRLESRPKDFLRVKFAYQRAKNQN